MQAIQRCLNNKDAQKISKQPICVNCSKNIGQVVRLCVKRNGVFVPYGDESAQTGDLWVCPICHVEIIQGFGEILDKDTSDQVLKSDYAVLKGVKDFLNMTY